MPKLHGFIRTRLLNIYFVFPTSHFDKKYKRRRNWHCRFLSFLWFSLFIRSYIKSTDIYLYTNLYAVKIFAKKSSSKIPFQNLSQFQKLINVIISFFKIFSRNFRKQAIILLKSKNFLITTQATSIESGCSRENFKRRQIRRVERSVDDVSSRAARGGPYL